MKFQVRPQKMPKTLPGWLGKESWPSTPQTWQPVKALWTLKGVTAEDQGSVASHVLILELHSQPRCLQSSYWRPLADIFPGFSAETSSSQGGEDHKDTFLHSTQYSVLLHSQLFPIALSPTFPLVHEITGGFVQDSIGNAMTPTFVLIHSTLNVPFPGVKNETGRRQQCCTSCLYNGSK